MRGWAASCYVGDYLFVMLSLLQLVMALRLQSRRLVPCGGLHNWAEWGITSLLY
jgi:hypothetical protein